MSYRGYIMPATSARPVRIAKGPKGPEFYNAMTGEQLTKPEAIAMMRAFKHGSSAERTISPRQRKPRVERPWLVAAYRTNLNTRKSVTIEEVQASTFAAASMKLASLCMAHQGDETHAIEFRIEQEAA